MITGFKTVHPANIFVICSNAEFCRHLTVSIIISIQFQKAKGKYISLICGILFYEAKITDCRLVIKTIYFKTTLKDTISYEMKFVQFIMKLTVRSNL